MVVGDTRAVRNSLSQLVGIKWSPTVVLGGVVQVEVGQKCNALGLVLGNSVVTEAFVSA